MNALQEPNVEAARKQASEEAFLDHCIEYKVADSRDEREQAFRLLYYAYLRQGLAAPNQAEMRITPYHLLPTTHVFVSRYARNVISTMTLVEDGQLGLPIEEAYGVEVNVRRRASLRLAEVSCLADRRQDVRRFLPVFMRLCGLVVQFAEHRRIDELVIAVHPRHARFYERYMGFLQFGEVRTYAAVEHAPAVALSMNPSSLKHESPDTYQRLVGGPRLEEELRAHLMPPEERSHFRQLLQASRATTALR